MEIIEEYGESYYQGPAIKIDAGVLVLEAFKATEAAGYRVVG